MNLDQNIICPDCFNIPLLGLNFNEKDDNLKNLIEIYSYCIYHHKNYNKANLNKNYLNNIISNSKRTNNIIITKEINCEYCNKKPFEYHCLECKRNICKNCFAYHKNHRHYYNYDYISEQELEQINNKIISSNDNINYNIDLIEKQILKYELELLKLKNLFLKYKEINEQLNSFSKYILDKYSDLLKYQKPIYYPIYFNVKNILKFDSMKLTLPEEDLSIKSFTDIISEKICSGLYYILSNSNYSTNLSDYNKANKLKINFDINIINDFIKKNIEYERIIPLNENKFVGIYDKHFLLDEVEENEVNTKNKKTDKGIEIYNIKNQIVETRIKSKPNDIFYNQENNIIIFKYDYSIDVYNFRDFTLLQTISIGPKRKKRKIEGSSLWKKESTIINTHCELIHVEFITKNTLGVIFEGDLSNLGEDVEKLIDEDDIDVINIGQDNNNDEDNDSYSYFIVYQRENDNSHYIPKKVSLLIKMDIWIKEVPYTSGEFDIENDNIDSYCTFKLDSITKISEEEYIIAFKSRIEAKKSQGYFIITDKFYENEIIYYYLNWKDHLCITDVIGNTREDTYLFKNNIDDKYYFIYKNSDDFASEIKNYFSERNLSLITIDVGNKLDVRNLYIEKYNIIGWNSKSLYMGRIVNGELEIIHNFDFPENDHVKLISLENKCIYYNNQDNNWSEEDNNNLIEEDDDDDGVDGVDDENIE